ncbi:DoxX family protein [Ktedonosporobacter rubrisoli]|uniref:DoxX family protein n=1 Tax=Ktedonosporobacter rubrisoli TaxID=2509675 RepID=A0A4V0YY59_KTERU|nr:DoxX family protein [Ktedonosporobacter rubrisoli]QBD75081.1 DoxX family protein [Ktedonosporobacter rubrisoli]
MNIALWIVQILLALLFAASGFQKIAQPVEKLREEMRWAKYMAPAFIRLIGILEILGALGLILPKATGYLPWLTPLAGVGLALTMFVAILVHLRLRLEKTVVPVVLMLLSLFVALGYFVFIPVV